MASLVTSSDLRVQEYKAVCDALHKMFHWKVAFGKDLIRVLKRMATRDHPQEASLYVVHHIAHYLGAMFVMLDNKQDALPRQLIVKYAHCVNDKRDIDALRILIQLMQCISGEDVIAMAGVLISERVKAERNE